MTKRKSTIFQRPERICQSRVAAEQDAMPASLDGVAVVAAIGVCPHARSPMVHAEGPDIQRTGPHAFIPPQFADRFISRHAEQVARPGGSHDGGTAALE